MLIYDNGVYRDNNTALSTIREEINYISESMTIQRDKTLVPYKLTISKRNAIIELVKTYTFKNIKDFDHRDNRINFKNGHLIRTKQKKVFIEHFKHNENPYLLSPLNIILSLWHYNFQRDHLYTSKGYHFFSYKNFAV